LLSEDSSYIPEGDIIEEEKLQQKRIIEENFADDIIRKIVFGPPKSSFNMVSPSMGEENLTRSLSQSRVPIKKVKQKKEKRMILCEVDFDCCIRFNREIYIPGLGLKKDMGLKIIGVKDIKDVSFWLDKNADYVAFSHVESIEDIEEIRELIGKRPVKVLAKIQNKLALQNLQSIIESSDGIVIERGVLRMNLSAANMVYVQDFIIQKCKLYGKPVFISSQIMDSMVSNPLPTRSEEADVSLAIHQGVDGLILSGETAFGEFYMESLMMMSKMCVESEKHTDRFKHYFLIEEYSYRKLLKII
jgi:pyruvate kinase